MGTTSIPKNIYRFCFVLHCLGIQQILCVEKKDLQKTEFPIFPKQRLQDDVGSDGIEPNCFYSIRIGCLGGGRGDRKDSSPFEGISEITCILHDNDTVGHKRGPLSVHSLA